jgi:hypothetical protein
VSLRVRKFARRCLVFTTASGRPPMPTENLGVLRGEEEQK